MARITTLLIVTLLGGGPANSLACDLWCILPAAHASAACPHAATRTAIDRPIATGDDCHGAVASAPFLAEARQSAAGPVATPVAHALRSTDPDGGWAREEWRSLHVEPARERSCRVVLRI